MFYIQYVSQAVKRVVERNGLSEKEAEARLASQPTNSEQVEQANVVFSSLWRQEFTRKQVTRAWTALGERLNQNKPKLQSPVFRVLSSGLLQQLNNAGPTSRCLVVIYELFCVVRIFLTVSQELEEIKTVCQVLLSHIRFRS